MSEKEFIIRKPDDWHLHLRDGEMLASVIQHSAANFERAIIMPNLVPPVLTTDDAIAYRERINQVIPPWDVLSTVDDPLSDGSNQDFRHQAGG